MAHQLGHVLMGEGDRRISLLQRLLIHGECTARYNIYYGEGRDLYDLRGRTAHESIFNVERRQLPLSQLAAGILAFQHLDARPGLGHPRLRGAIGIPRYAAAGRVRRRGARVGGRRRRAGAPRPTAVATAATLGTSPLDWFYAAALATADFYLANSCADGIPMWDTGAPNLYRLGDYLDRTSDPFNPWEPVDSSAAAIAAQGLIRLGNHLAAKGDARNGARYRQAGLTIANALFDEPYLSPEPRHQGLILHSVYHRPNAWDRIAPGQKVPNGESSMWGDYHARELALLLLREAAKETTRPFFDSHEADPGPLAEDRRRFSTGTPPRLGIELPCDDQILTGSASPLAQPADGVRINGKRIGNRCAVQPMEGWDATTRGGVTEPMLRRWQRFGQSGAKLIFGGEAMAVRPGRPGQPEPAHHQ